MTTLIVIPTLNEAEHIGAVLDGIAGFAASHDARIVVADGGSTDGTRAIVTERASQTENLHFLDNPLRFQSAAVNLAVETHGANCEMLIRLDAHSAYPSDFCEVLLREASTTGADSVVVTMHAVGKGPLQHIVAAAQNSRFGNGASAHRNRTKGAWVDHGHHALMRIAAFRQVGGYDPDFSHNEDAELDYRLRQAGFRIWLTAKTGIEYFPRATLSGLMLQYFRFGRGRARNLAKHHARPARRQSLVAALAPALLLSLLTPVHPVFALPLMFWILGCIAAGVLIIRESRSPRNILAGPVAGLMQLSWSAGFWRQKLAPATGRGTA